MNRGFRSTQRLDHDVIVLYRLPMSDPIRQLIQKARTAGKPVNL